MDIVKNSKSIKYIIKDSVSLHSLGFKWQGKGKYKLNKRLSALC